MKKLERQKMKIDSESIKTAQNIYKNIKKSVGVFTDKSKKVIKETLDDVKEKTEPKIRETLSYFEYTMNPPKAEVLSKECMKLQKKYLFETAYLNQLKNQTPQNPLLIFKLEKELMLLEQKVLQTRDKYNRFVAQQNAAQAAFDRLNNF